MFAVIFEVIPTLEGKAEYLKIAAELRNFLERQEGFISIERFQSLIEEGKLLSLSFWQDEAAIGKWRNLLEHRSAQQRGKDSLFQSYRIRVAEVVRDYSGTDRNNAPTDSNNRFDEKLRRST
jgi:heme-degrading monooxygenase HmoA